jgi:hypothetical protein
MCMGARGAAGEWKASVELEGKSFLVTVPMAANEEPSELRLAIARACVASIPPEVMPLPWMQGVVDTMAGA